MPDPARAAQIERFLAAAGWGRAERRPLAGDASFRRYDRLRDGSRRAVLMDAPPPHEDVRPFMRIARHLAAVGLSAPDILEADEAAGLLLLEDLGDDLYTRVLRSGAADEAELYGVAADVLAALHDAPAGEAPPYDEARLLAEADLLVEWYLPLRAGRAMPAEVVESYRAAWRAVLPVVLAGPQRMVLRDYHADNLLWLPERTAARRCGLLDFQDAVVGSPAYDLVSLLEDARRDVAGATVTATLQRYHALVNTRDLQAFSAAYAVLGGQRNAKIVGIFARLWKRDGKPQYMDYLPRVWGHLAGDLAHPALEPVRRWFDANVPGAWRKWP